MKRFTQPTALVACSLICLFWMALLLPGCASMPSGNAADEPAKDAGEQTEAASVNEPSTTQAPATPAPKPEPPALARVLPQPLFDKATAAFLQTTYEQGEFGLVLKTLEGFDLSSVSEEVQRRVAFLKALNMVKLGRGEDAAALLGPLADSDDVLADYYRYFHARALLMHKQYEAAQKEASRIGTDSLWHTEAILLKVRCAAALGNHKPAMTDALAVADIASNGETIQALRLAFTAAVEQKLREQAYAIARRLYAQHPTATDAAALTDMLKRAGKSYRKADKAPDYLQRGNYFFGTFKYPEAMKEYDTGLKHSKKKSETWCRLKTQTARSWFRKRRYRNSLKHIDPVIAHCKKYADIHEQALHVKGFSLYKLGRGSESAPVLEQQLKLYPKSTWTAPSMRLMTDIAFRAKNDEAARSWARKLATAYPDDPQATEKLWLSAWTAYSNGSMDIATPLLKEISADTKADPIQRQRALYWLGRIAHRAKDSDGAAVLYKQALNSHPLSFYGLLSARRLESIDPKTYAEATLLPRKKPFPLTYHVPWEELRGIRNGFVENMHLQRGLALLATGMLAGPTAGSEFNAARKDATDDVQAQWLLSLLLYRAGDHVRAVHIARNAMLDSHYHDAPDEENAPYWLLAYPRPYGELLDISMALHGRSPRNSAELMLALMREESSFNPTIGSFANAIGLTQIIKSTAKQIARELKEKQFDFYDLTTPEVAIRFGTHHLGGLIRGFKGRLPLAIASYNAGGSRIRGWVKQRGNLPMDEFLESMTIAQPRRYTKRLLRSYAIYRYLYTDSYPVLDISLAPPGATK